VKVAEATGGVRFACAKINCFGLQFRMILKSILKDNLKNFFTLIMGVDKRGNKLTKRRKDMGLDQQAHLRGQEIDWEKYYSDDNYAEENKVFVWRKHARLQQFMAQKWDEQNSHHEHKGTLSHLGFNGDCDAPVYLTKEVVDELAEQIEKDYADYPATDGFFWGQQFQEESVKEYKEQDIKFLKFCQQAIDEKKVVEYWCSW
jgi:hypothetical protein